MKHCRKYKTLLYIANHNLQPRKEKIILTAHDSDTSDLLTSRINAQGGSKCTASGPGVTLPQVNTDTYTPSANNNNICPTREVTLWCSHYTGISHYPTALQKQHILHHYVRTVSRRTSHYITTPDPHPSPGALSILNSTFLSPFLLSPGT